MDETERIHYPGPHEIISGMSPEELLAEYETFRDILANSFPTRRNKATVPGWVPAFSPFSMDASILLKRNV